MLFLLLCMVTPVFASDDIHPRLMISPADVSLMAEQGPDSPLFSAEVAETRAGVDRYLAELPDVPLPKDPGGGYTHEQHKRNGSLIRDAGVIYQLTGEVAYAEIVRDILLAYAAMYPDLPEHPQKKGQSPGKLFWQSLNEAVWLVYSIQGYDAVIDVLTEQDRTAIEAGLFRPMVSFLADESPQTFDRIHNHGTWAAAAVGMTGYVLNDPEYVEKALYGLKKDGSAGFMKQLDELFSPDGYYSEGPYYQRYAMMPFLFFATAINRNDPARKIFEYRDGVLLKAVYTTIQLSYAGYFFPINDALKDKGLDTIELVYGVAIAFGLTADRSLLSIAREQGRVVLTGDGFAVVQAIEAGEAKPFVFKSMFLRDGSDGEQGALVIMRSDQQALIFKSTAQGMGHGHFDKLAWFYYDNGHEIVSDYGAARFLNVEEKAGGRYLPENNSWAKQTVAHNTLVVDETSHFEGDWKKGELNHPEPLVFEMGDSADIAAARMKGAYEGVVFSRVMMLLKSDLFPRPVVLDVLRIESDENHQYDLPLHYKGQITSVSHDLDPSTRTMTALGDDNGYQHLWLRAQAEVGNGELFKTTWLNDDRFYTYTVLADGQLQAIFTETGAGDPDFNLRREQGLILRAADVSSHTFVSVLEPHGEYNGSREFTTASASHIRELQRASKADTDIIRIVRNDGEYVTVALSWNRDAGEKHSVDFNGTKIEWSGFYRVIDSRGNGK